MAPRASSSPASSWSAASAQRATRTRAGLADVIVPAAVLIEIDRRDPIRALEDRRQERGGGKVSLPVVLEHRHPVLLGDRTRGGETPWPEPCRRPIMWRGMDLFDRLKAALTGRYTLERKLGAGGMAAVYLAHDVRHNRKVAIKVMHPDLAAIVGAERFLNEIQTTAKLQHPHILPLFDSGLVEGTVFYVIPYLEGESLRARLARETQLPIADALRSPMASASS